MFLGCIKQRNKYPKGLALANKDKNDWNTFAVNFISTRFVFFQKISTTVRTYVGEHHGWRRASCDIIILILDLVKKKGIAGLVQSVKEYIYYANLPSAVDFNIRPAAYGRTISEPPPLPSLHAPVDIIVCVHNALSDVRRCLESLFAHTSKPYSIIVIDDGSDQDTAAYLAEIAARHQVNLVRNEEARGYTFAANQGLQASASPYLLLLNSDTIVTPGWLDRMVACAESDPSIGLVGPLSNTASWQSIPYFEQEGDWADNVLPDGLTSAGMADLLGAHSGRLYPRIAFLNGFCLLISRRAIDTLGIFDEENFGSGYGEENDYCLRARKGGFSLAIADDAYVYHAQSRSYSSERRKMLCELAGKALAEKHGEQIIAEGVRACLYDRVLEGIRAGSRAMIERWQLRNEGRRKWQGKRILFLLPVSDAGGGSNVVVQEAEAMQAMGADVAILNMENFRKTFSFSYPELNGRIPVIFASDIDEIPRLAQDYDAVVATANISVAWMTGCVESGRKQVRGYYVQDFEPYFHDKGTAAYKVAWDSYTLFPDLVCFTKTDWNSQEVQLQTGAKPIVVGPSVNIDLFRPRPRCEGNWPQRPLRIAAMIRPNSPRRGPRMTMEVLQDVAAQHGSAVEIIIFGCMSDDPSFVVLPHDFPWRNEGKLSRQELAWLLNEVDIFADFSTFQAMGLTAMEAMACGAAVIVPEAGGASSFLVNERNGLMIDTTSKKACIAALNRLIRDTQLRGRLQREAIADITQFHPEKAADRILQALFGED